MKNEKKSGMLPQIIVAVVIALLVGTSAPWWWKALFKPDPPPPEPSIGFTDNWAGSWICKCDKPEHEMYLTITGKGWSSSLNANYPKAYGNKPATEEYIIKNISKSSVSGEYLYKDESPNIGYQSKRGLWKGNWIMTKDSNTIHLTRKDYTTSWQGQYRCIRR